MQVLVRQAAGLQPQVILIPTWLALFAANFTPWYYRMTGSKPRFTRYSVVTVTGNSDISSQRARSELGYQPRSLHESLQDTVQWWHAYLQNKTGETCRDPVTMTMAIKQPSCNPGRLSGFR
jgi:dihydroflavonol-4-reductase